MITKINVESDNEYNAIPAFPRSCAEIYTEEPQKSTSVRHLKYLPLTSSKLHACH